MKAWPLTTKPLDRLIRGGERNLFAISLVILAVSALLLGFALRTEHNVSAVRTARTQTPFSLGQEITMGSVTLMASHPAYSGGSGNFASPAGMHYLILDLSVRNNSAKAIQVMPTTDTYVKDAAGHVIYVTPFGLSRPFRAGELSPGETVNGQLSYLVPVKSPLKLYVDSIWSGGVLPIQL
jgi:hypothetical protein